MKSSPPGDGGRVLVSTHGSVAEVRLNRPEARNAIDDALQDELIAAFEAVAANRELHALVLTGEGTAFCAGGDVNGMRERLGLPLGQVGANGWRRLKRTQRMVTTLDDLEAVTVAAVNGSAVGVGMDLALCCDVLVAAESASFSMAYTRRGLVPDGGGMFYLPRRVGLSHAKDLIFSGRTVGAEEALAIGIADRVVPDAELGAAALGIADGYRQGTKTAVALAKAVLNRSFELSREEIFARSAEAQAICYTTDEHRAAVSEFLERGSAPRDPDA